jgi:nucleotide-binding universal stress UspA family protein
VLSAVEPLLAEAARARAGLDLEKAEVEPALREFVRGVVPDGASWAPAVALDARVGEADDVIVDEAVRQDVDLVVMGTQGLGGFRKLMLGSTTERVLRRTRTPVLAVPPASTDAVVVDERGARLTLERMLVATDFSAAATAALRWALTAADKLNLPLVLAHVVQETSAPSQWRSFAEDSNEERMLDARRRLEELARQECGNRKCDIVVSIGRPAESIAAIAQEHRTGLIVMGLTSEQGPFARRPGSIAYPILSDARVPVVVVPAV